MTASRLASATIAFCLPARLEIFIAQAFNHDHFFTSVSRVCAASYNNERIIASPQQDIRPIRLLSPDSLSFGVNPRIGPTALEFLNRCGVSIVLTKARETTGPTPGTVISSRQISSWQVKSSTFLCSLLNSSRSFVRVDSKTSMISSSSGKPSTSSRPLFKLDLAYQPNLQTKITQQPSDVILNGNGFFLKQLTCRQ